MELTHVFFPPPSEKDKGGFPFDLDDFAEKVVSKMAQKLNTQKTSSSSAGTVNPAQSTTSSNASNLLEYLDKSSDFEIIIEENSWILRCYSFTEFLSSPVFFSPSFCRPLGGISESLATGLHLSEEVYQQLITGKCEKWYHQKEAFGKHLSSKTHSNATNFMKLVKQGKSREVLVTKNQLRPALGIVKTKSAAIQYEERIAEHHAAGADVGDFDHSSKLFSMLTAASAYIDKKTSVFLSTPLPSMGMPPHFYVTADKLKNHQATNQITVICPVVNGCREGIVLNAREVYTSSDGTGGTHGEQAKPIYPGLEKNVGLKGEHLLQVQGRVMDSQYVSVPFIDGMNEPHYAVI